MGTALDTATTRCENMIASLAIPRPFDLEQFLSIVAERRGRRIKLIEARLGADQPCGMLISTADVDYIYCVEDVSPLQAQHTVMHEVGHLLFDHGGDQSQVAEPETLAHLLPNLSPALVKRLLGRTAYASEHEREAELFASLMLMRVGLSSETYCGIAPDGAPDLEAMAWAFGDVRSGAQHG